MAPYNSRHTAPPALLKSFRQSLQFDGETYSSLRYPAPVYVNLPMGRLREGYERSTATSTPTDFYDECESETEGCADSELGLVKQQPPPSDHLFSLNKKKAIIYLVAVAALFSPLSSNIYFPALQTIAKDLHVSTALVQTTVSSYMIFQGLAPSFWGPLSDIKGRRPILIATFSIYIGANVGLSQVQSFPALFTLRALQAIGGVSSLSIGAGVVGDITTKAERGGLMGVFQGLQMMGRSFGPVLGGVLSQFGGFRSIFWFLAGLSMAVIVCVVLLLPETLRPIAGRGEVRTSGIYRPLALKSPPYATERTPVPGTAKKEKLTLSAFTAPLKFAIEPDVFASLLFGGVVYAVYSMLSASTTASLQTIYGLNDLQVGLAFGANGIGCVLGSISTGIIVDRDYRKLKKKHDRKIKEGLMPADPDFPIEKARLRSAWIMILIFGFSIFGYGWALETREHLVVPLVFQFLVGWASTGIFNMNSTLVVDLFPGKSASATAVNNLIRCGLGAVGVAVIEPLIQAVGSGYAFSILSAITYAASALVWVELKYGGGWRRERERRLKINEN